MTYHRLIVPMAEVIMAMDAAEAKMLHFREINPEPWKSALQEWATVLVGQVGEKAVELWALDKGLNPKVQDRDEKYSITDFIFRKGNILIEVKSRKAMWLNSYPELRMPVAKIKKIMRFAPIVVNCKVYLNWAYRSRNQMIQLYKDGVQVDLLGWEYATQIYHNKPVIDGAHVYQIEDLRPMEDLIELAVRQDAAQEVVLKEGPMDNLQNRLHPREAHHNAQKKKRIKKKIHNKRNYKKALKNMGVE